MTEAAMFVIVCTLVNKFQNEYQIDSPILLDFHVTSAVQTDEYAEREKIKSYVSNKTTKSVTEGNKIECFTKCWDHEDDK